MLNIGNKKGQAKARNRVGLDIGSYSIKMVEVAVSQEKPRLLGMGIKDIPGRTRDTLPDSIKALAAEARIASKAVNISVSGSAVIVRFISMPRMTDEELKSAIKFEAEKFIPFNINDCIIDFQMLRKNERENKIDVLLAAAKREYIEERIAVVEASGFSVEVVDVDSFAISNAFFANYPAADPDKSFALLNIGASLSNLSIVKNGIIYLVRDMVIGSKDFDAAIVKSLGIDAKASEEIKLKPRGVQAQEALACAKGVFNTLVDEMKLPFSYYENQCGRGVDEIYLSGGGAALAGLEDMFQDAFGSKPIPLDPTQFLDLTSSAIDRSLFDRSKSALAVSLGLALR